MSLGSGKGQHGAKQDRGFGMWTEESGESQGPCPPPPSKNSCDASASRVLESASCTLSSISRFSGLKVTLMELLNKPPRHARGG